MIEPPQFRTVIRGADPEQVAETINELRTSLVTAQRAAADKTGELGRLEREHSATQAALRDAERRIAELGKGHASHHSYHELGSRISSILGLADEEASRMRVEATAEVAQRLEQSNQDALMVRREARDEAERVRAAAASAAEEIVVRALEEAEVRRRELDVEQDAALQVRDRALSEGDRLLVTAHQEAEQILQRARDEAVAMRANVEGHVSEAVQHRDRVKAHLAELSGVIAALAASIPGSAPVVSAPVRAGSGNETAPPPEVTTSPSEAEGHISRDARSGAAATDAFDAAGPAAAAENHTISTDPPPPSRGGEALHQEMGAPALDEQPMEAVATVNEARNAGSTMGASVVPSATDPADAGMVTVWPAR